MNDRTFYTLCCLILLFTVLFIGYVFWPRSVSSATLPSGSPLQATAAPAVGSRMVVGPELQPASEGKLLQPALGDASQLQ